MDTIFALASARGKSGIAVVRISGPDVANAFAAFRIDAPEPRRATLVALRSEEVVVDQALVLFFRAPQSFTGEDVLEFQLHGSIAVVDAVLRRLSSVQNFRQAEPGEFTRRALENEHLDLSQVEGLSDLIEAETEMQRRQAMRVFSGALGRQAEIWRRDLIRAAALVEATIDFSDEDVPEDVMPEVRELLLATKESLEQEAAGVAVAERVRDGFEVAIVGKPNVGKSTLLNALAGREAAITSEVAGTTRDVIEVRMDLRGLPVTILDTAGIRASSDAVEAIGVERAYERAESADLRVILLEERGEGLPIKTRPDDIVVVSKSDLRDGDISAATGQGIDRLVGQIAEKLQERATGAGIAIRERHRVAMERTVASLGIALDHLDNAPGMAEILAEELRHAVRALDSLSGRVDVEHLLDEIFANFCIGK